MAFFNNQQIATDPSASFSPSHLFFMSSSQLTLALAPLKPPDLPLPSPSRPEAVRSTPVVRDRQGWSEQPPVYARHTINPWPPPHAHRWKQSVIVNFFILKCGFLQDKLFDQRWICCKFEESNLGKHWNYMFEHFEFHLISFSIPTCPSPSIARSPPQHSCSIKLHIKLDMYISIKHAFN